MYGASTPAHRLYSGGETACPELDNGVSVTLGCTAPNLKPRYNRGFTSLCKVSSPVTG